MQLLSKVHVECLIHGNVTMTEAVDIIRLVESKLRAVPHIMPLLQRQLILYREIKLEDGKCSITTKYLKKSEFF